MTNTRATAATLVVPPVGKQSTRAGWLSDDSVVQERDELAPLAL
jgi:hypothetical protein